MRIFYNVDNGQLDPQGDTELRAVHLERPFDFGRSAEDLLAYVALVSRPYVICKRANDEPATPLARVPVGATVRLLFARPPRSRDEAGDQPSVPFDLSSTAGTAEPIVVFDDATLVPLLLCRIAAAEVPRSGAASGIVSVVKEASE